MGKNRGPVPQDRLKLNHVEKLRRYLVDDLGIKQAEGSNDRTVIEAAIKTMQAMTRAYGTVCDALAVATGDPEAVGKSAPVRGMGRAEGGFTVEDNRQVVPTDAAREMGKHIHDAGYAARKGI